MARMIRIDDDIYECLKKMATPFEDTPNTVLRKILRSTQSLTEQAEEGKEQDKIMHKRKKGELTRQSVYEEWLIYTLWDEFKGRAKRADITEATISNMQRRNLLKKADFEKVSTGETRAANTIAWSRNRLKDEGFISSDSPFGFWELTGKGIDRAKNIEDYNKINRLLNEKREIQSSVAPPYQNTFKSDGHLQLKRSHAIGIEKEGSKKFIVKKGAIALNIQGSLSGSYLEKRQEMEAQGLFRKVNKGYELLDDYEFDSKAQATNVLLGVSESANRAWKNI